MLRGEIHCGDHGENLCADKAHVQKPRLSEEQPRPGKIPSPWPSAWGAWEVPVPYQNQFQLATTSFCDYKSPLMGLYQYLTSLECLGKINSKPSPYVFDPHHSVLRMAREHSLSCTVRPRGWECCRAGPTKAIKASIVRFEERKSKNLDTELEVLEKSTQQMATKFDVPP